MREIKFRAWLEGKHGNSTFLKPHMEYDVSIGPNGYLDIEGGWDIHGSIETVPLMQYTGLKDKNFKHIYGGDIVINRHTGFQGTVEYSGQAAAWWIKNEKGFSGLSEKTGMTGSEDGITLDSVEIIGNIYEK